ncbi:Rho GTPase-activating protein 11A [Camponotus floridanus]|uniref:Rho GTPase-activating protein 11A n=1 Tax=Camponotus floridanus TaxID=104421 RepID=E2A965_CAMFO|nr:Rho GTPase-activating protein 11A [Camponotus floridanus]
MLIYDVLHKEKVYHIVAKDLRSFGVKYRFKKSMLKSERPEACKNISKRVFKTALFYQPLDIVNLSSGAIVHVPVFVIQASTFLEKYITQEGLFRKAGSQARQKELMSRLDNGGNLGEKNYAIDVANCLKSFFRDLPEPLIPYTYHDLFVHCALLKSYRILIENSENIGILPPHIAQSISTETSGSTDNGLDSFEHGNYKKKKHRSGSLTRMFNGLKKMVGKGTDDTPNINHLHPAIHSAALSNMSSNKFTKKRKVAEKEYPPSVKKKRVTEKLDKPKKLRLSLDKFAPKNRQKNADDLLDLYMNNYKSSSERRWSSQEYDDIFIDATVDLSDDDGDQNLLINKNHCKNDEQWHMNISTNSRKLNATDESDICLIPEEKTDSEEFNTFPNADTISLSSDNCEEDYVKISKKEYEEIKNRVSAIESRISQEFGCIYNEENNMTAHSVNKVQTAYEKTLEEASIENTLTSDYLAKKLSKELKIRRSREHKIIRSPSARKIGSLRRRSQEKVASKRIRRTASWHISPEYNLQHHAQLEKQGISWKDADKYFQSVSRTNTPAPQTGRASVAKLRTQNAGMVLAKAKLFDECTTKTSEFIPANVLNKKQCDNNANKHSLNTMDVNTEHVKQSCKRTQVSRKQSNKDLKNKILSPNASVQIKTQIIDTSLKPLHERLDKNYRSAQKFELQNQKFSNKDQIIHQTFSKDKGINVTGNIEIHQKENITRASPLVKMSMSTMLETSNMSPYKSDVNKTPHIKRPLTVKTPKSSKLVRRPPVDTRRTPLKATAQLGTPKRQSPKSILKTKALSMHT